MTAVRRTIKAVICAYCTTMSFTILISSYLSPEVVAVQGCSVFFQPDFKWKRALCDSENPRLTTIPTDLPRILVDLRFTHQEITLVTSQGLSHLTHLQSLYIESSGLKRVTNDAFTGLTNLQQLNIRNNSLKLGVDGLPSQAFASLPRLEWLNVAENPIDFVPASYFKTAGGTQLRKLQINSVKNVALRFAQDSLSGLERLQVLDISYSGVTELPSSLEANLNTMIDLRELYLGGNPWNCDCHLRWLRTWIIRRHYLNDLQYIRTTVHSDGRTTQSEPICFTPSHMKGRRLVPSPQESSFFYCPPKVITRSSNLSIEHGKTYILSCEFFSDQSKDHSVTWYRNGLLIYNDTSVNSRLFLRSSEATVDQQQPLLNINDGTVVSELNYTFVDPSLDSGLWNCRLHTPNGQPEIVGALFHISVLSMGHHLSDTSGRNTALTVDQWNWIYAAIGVILLFLLLAGIGVAIFYCCDPRTHPDHLFYRTLGKDRTVCPSPPPGCRSCQKFMGPFDNSTPHEESECDNYNKGGKLKPGRTWKIGKPKINVIVNGITEKDEDDGNKQSTVTSESGGYPLSVCTEAVATTKAVGIIHTAITMPTNSVSGMVSSAFGTPTFLVRSVSGGCESNRLLVSCDGPEPTVLLPAESNTANDSPASAIYAFPASIRHIKSSMKCAERQPTGYTTASLSLQYQPAVAVDNTDKIGLPISMATFETPKTGMLVNRPLPFLTDNRKTTPCPVHGNISIEAMLKANREITYPDRIVCQPPQLSLQSPQDAELASVTTLRSSSSNSRKQNFIPATRILQSNIVKSSVNRERQSTNLINTLSRSKCAITSPENYPMQSVGNKIDLIKKATVRHGNQSNLSTGSRLYLKPGERCVSPLHLIIKNSEPSCEFNASHEPTVPKVTVNQPYYSSRQEECHSFIKADIIDCGEPKEDDYDYEEEIDSSVTWNSSKPSISTDSNTPPGYGAQELDTSSPSHCSWHHPVSNVPYELPAHSKHSRQLHFKAQPFARAQSQVIPFVHSSSSPRTNKFASTLPSRFRKANKPASYDHFTVQLHQGQFLHRSQTELYRDSKPGIGIGVQLFQPKTMLVRPGSKHKLEPDSDDDDDDNDCSQLMISK